MYKQWLDGLTIRIHWLRSLDDSSLDGFGTDEFLKIIRFIIKDANVFVISHKVDLQDKFESVIKFEKVKGFSRKTELWNN